MIPLCLPIVCACLLVKLDFLAQVLDSGNMSTFIVTSCAHVRFLRDTCCLFYLASANCIVSRPRVEGGGGSHIREGD